MWRALRLIFKGAAKSDNVAYFLSVVQPGTNVTENGLTGFTPLPSAVLYTEPVWNPPSKPYRVGLTGERLG
jgi:hypothetical protein